MNKIDIVIQAIQKDYKNTGELQSFKFIVLDDNIKFQYGNLQLNTLNNIEFKKLTDKTKNVFKDNIQILELMCDQCEDINKSIRNHTEYLKTFEGWLKIFEDLTLTNKFILINKIKSIYEFDIKKLNMINQDFQLLCVVDKIKMQSMALDYQEIKSEIHELGKFLENKHCVDLPYRTLLDRYETERTFSRRFMNALYHKQEFSQEDRLKLVQEKIMDLLENDMITPHSVKPAKTSNGETALHLAVLAGDKASIDLIKEHWGDHFFTLLEEVNDQLNLTPLQLAIYEEKIDIANYLVELGANPAIHGIIETYDLPFLTWLSENKKLAAIDFCLSHLRVVVMVLVF